MMQTFSTLIRRTITRLSMVSGAGVQVYSEDIIAEFMQHSFTSLFDMTWWDDHCFWVSDVLTVDGVPSMDLSDENGADIDRYADIQYIYYDQDRNPLPRVWERQNVPYLMTRGTRPAYHEPWGAPGKFFRVLPFGDEQPVHIRYRKRPEPFAPDDLVNFDDQALILGAAWEYLEDDGSNPAAAEKNRMLYNQRVTQLLSQRGDQEVPLRDSNRAELENWREIS